MPYTSNILIAVSLNCAKLIPNGVANDQGFNTEVSSENWSHWRGRVYRKRHNDNVWYVQVLPTC